MLSSGYDLAAILTCLAALVGLAIRYLGRAVSQSALDGAVRAWRETAQALEARVDALEAAHIADLAALAEAREKIAVLEARAGADQAVIKRLRTERETLRTTVRTLTKRVAALEAQAAGTS